MYQLETTFWWYQVLHELVGDTVRNHSPGGGLSILDAGCGTGRMMEILRQYGEVHGIDSSPDAVELARKRGVDKVILGDLNNYAFDKETYDIVVCLDVLYHKGIRDDLAVAGKFYSALKENGILILNLPAFEYLRRPHDLVVHTKKRYRRKCFSTELEKIGFTIHFSSYRMFPLYFIILISGFFRKSRKMNQPDSDLKKIPGWLNKFLLFYGRAENQWLKRGWTLPAGSSLFVVAKKEGINRESGF